MSGDSDGLEGVRTSVVPSVSEAQAWWIYRGARGSFSAPLLADTLPPPPPWRDFDGGPVVTSPPPDDEAENRRRLGGAGTPVQAASTQEIEMVNAALFLRRPLIVTGPPGIGKSSLAHQVSRELGLGRVLRWTVTSRSTLKEGLYSYDAIGRVQEAAARGALHRPVPGEVATGDGGPDPTEEGAGLGIGDFVQLGPLGTALIPRAVPRVLLIDEFDKADMDLANDLLGAFEEGEFRIPELSRLARREPDVEVQTDDPMESAVIHQGRVRCRAFPFIVITSNGERSFPPAFLRRCVSLEMPPPSAERLAAMLEAQFTTGAGPERTEMIREFLTRSLSGGTLAADQLLNSEYLRIAPAGPDPESWKRVLHALWRRLGEVGSG